MIYQETNQTRRIVGRLDAGDACLDRLTEFCREHDVRAGEIRAVGRLSEIEVVRLDPESGEYEETYAGEGIFDLLQLSGNVSTLGDELVVRLHALLAAEGPLGPQLVAGQLRSATAVEFEFVLEAFEDLALERQLDPETGMLGLQSIRRIAESSEEESTGSIGGQSISWDDAAESAEAETSPEASDESEAAENDGEDAEAADSAEETDSETGADFEGLDLDEPMLESGDIIDHPKLGRCHVIKIEEDKYAHIRLPQGKIRKLSLNVVEIAYSGEENGRNVFEAQVSS